MTFLLPVFVGDEAVAYAIFDDEDHALAGYKWRHAENGYVLRNEGTGNDSRVIYAHRQILGLRPGDQRQGDHINRDKLDNRRANLRIATGAQNSQNTPARGGTSSHRGVSWDADRGKWQAKTSLNYRTHFHGRFDTEEEAAAAALAFRTENMPFSVEVGAS